MLDHATVARLAAFRGDPYPVVSVYLGATLEDDRRAVPARLKDLLKPVGELASELDRDAALSVRADIEAILDSADEIMRERARGVAIFASHGNDLFEWFALPRATRERAVLDDSPFVRPLWWILDEYRRYCGVVIDARQAAFFEYTMGRAEQLDTQVLEGVRKRNYGGWYGLEEHRVRNHADEAQHRHFRTTAKALFDLFGTDRFDLLAVGGHAETVNRFVDFLHPDVRSKLAGTFVIDPHTMTPAKVADAIRELEAAYNQAHEAEVVERLLSTAAAGGRAVLGVPRSVEAANMAAIDTLVLDRQAEVKGYRCDSCRLLYVDDGVCEVCGADKRLTPDLLEELANDVIDEGGDVEQISSETPMREHVVGALTRFPIPS